MRKFLFLLIGIVWVIPILADEEYDPTDPPEPYTRYKVETSATPFGYTSGGGMYTSDSQITISTSAYNQNYIFSHWTKNGEYYSDEMSFVYSVESQKTTFVAVYEFNPIDPDEPEATNQYRLYLTNNISSACSFNMSSGTKVEAGTYVTLTAYTSSNYDFLGWYEGDTKVSDELSFSYLMPEDNITLTAKFIYNPVDPDDPSSSSDDVLNTKLGDVDENGNVTLSDVVKMISAFLQGKQSELKVGICDVNQDGKITVLDIKGIVDILLK